MAGTLPLTIRLPLGVAVAEEHFKTSFYVDRFVSGECGWHFLGVEAELAKGPLVSISNLFIVANGAVGWYPTMESKLPKKLEDPVFNSNDEPVIWTCRFDDIRPDAPRTSFACRETSKKRSRKIQHVLLPGDSLVIANFLDATN